MENITTLKLDTDNTDNVQPEGLKESPHGSFGCYNKNYLLGAVINSSGILVDEKLRQEMIKKMTDLKTWCIIYLNKQYYKYEYTRLSKIIGPIDNYWNIINGSDYPLIKLLRGNRTNTREIIKAIMFYCLDKSKPYCIDSDKMTGLLGDEKYEIEFKRLIDQREGSDLGKLARSSKSHPQVMELLKDKLVFNQIIEFNKLNKKYASLIINNINVSIINKYSKTVFKFSNDFDYRKVIDDLVTNGEFDDSDRTYVLSQCLDTAKLDEFDYRLDYKNALKSYIKEVKIHPIIDKCIKDFDLILQLHNFYTEWHKYDEIEDIDIFTPIDSSTRLSYDNRVIEESEIRQLTNKLNFNSPSVKANFQSLLCGYHRDMRIRCLFFHARVVRGQADDGTDMESYKRFISDPKNIALDESTKNYDFVGQNIDQHEYLPIMYATKAISHILPPIHNLVISDTDIFSEEFEYFKTSFMYFTQASLQKQLSGYIQGQLEKDLHYIYKQNPDLSYDVGKIGPGWEDWRVYRPNWNVCGVTTKRWSAGIHTWKPGTDTFRLLVSEKDHVALYFDINSIVSIHSNMYITTHLIAGNSC